MLLYKGEERVKGKIKTSKRQRKEREENQKNMLCPNK